MEAKKTWTLAALKDAEKTEFNRIPENTDFRPKGTKNKKPEGDPNPPQPKSKLTPASSSGLGRGAPIKPRSRSPAENPEASHEPKGSRGRPRSMQPSVKKAVTTKPTKDVNTDENIGKNKPYHTSNNN